MVKWLRSWISTVLLIMCQVGSATHSSHHPQKIILAEFSLYVHLWSKTPFIDSHIHSFINSFIHLFIHSFIYSFIHLFIHSFIYSFIHLFIYSFIHLFIYSFT